MIRRPQAWLPSLLLCAALGAGQVPDFALRRLDGTLFRSADAVGRKVLVIDFWATWCGPCKQLLKKLQELQARYPDVQVLAVSIDDGSSLAQVNQYVQGRGFTFTVLLDPDTNLCRRVNPSKGVPYTMVVDRRGEVAFTHSGYLPGDERTLFAQVEAARK